MGEPEGAVGKETRKNTRFQSLHLPWWQKRNSEHRAAIKQDLMPASCQEGLNSEVGNIIEHSENRREDSQGIARADNFRPPITPLHCVD